MPPVRDLMSLPAVETWISSKLSKLKIGRRGAGRGHIGDLDAVHRPARVLRARALRREVRLLAGFVAADVDAVDQHARHAAHQRKRIARGRDLRQLVGGEVGGGTGHLGVDDRRLTSNRDRLGHRGQPQRHRQVGVTADRNHDAFVLDGGEAGELERHRVGARRLVEEAEFAGLVRHGRQRAVRPLDGDAHARQDGFLLVGDGTRNTATSDLRIRRQDGHQRDERCRQ
ncbi:MAG TPA: hypothetical protein VFP85_18415 [Vicinamibacterales bacterium]|nr:hypothetical protein [Vicinamibacterales bacterium]